MGKTLVLAEKPSVGREIARVLGCKNKGNGCLIGKNYIVTWALGHLVTFGGSGALWGSVQNLELGYASHDPEENGSCSH